MGKGFANQEKRQSALFSIIMDKILHVYFSTHYHKFHKKEFFYKNVWKFIII